MTDDTRTGLGCGRRGYAALLCAALVAACHAPPSAGVYLHREAYGGIVLHLSGGQSGRVEGDIAFTRLGVDGGVHVFARTLAGMRDGDLVRLRDPGGAEVGVALTARGARVTAPDGGAILLDRADMAGESAMLAAVARQAARLRGGTSQRSRPGDAPRPSPIVS